MKDKLRKVLRNHVDTRLPLFQMGVPPLFHVQQQQNSSSSPSLSSSQRKWVEVSFADPLKAITPLVSGLCYVVVRGQTVIERKLRNKDLTIPFNICGTNTGRSMLQYLGTNVFRQCFHKDIWVRIAERRVRALLKQGYNVVVSDVRFENEWCMLRDINVADEVALWTVAKKKEDMVLTQLDQMQHPSAWKYHTFHNVNTVLWNTSNIASLCEEVKLKVLHKLDTL